jgi:hypothetical protein
VGTAIFLADKILLYIIIEIIRYGHNKREIIDSIILVLGIRKKYITRAADYDIVIFARNKVVVRAVFETEIVYFV